MKEIKKRCKDYVKKRYTFGCTVSMTSRVGEVEVTLTARSIEDLLRLNDELTKRAANNKEH